MPTVLVSGATGQQGGATVEALLSYENPDLKIRALTRNTNSPAASKLKSRGLELIQGDLANLSSLEAALSGCDLAYLVTDFRGPGDVEGEIEKGRNFIEAAKRAGVSHVVFSSVAGCEDVEVEHFNSKFKIEQHLRDSGLSWSVIRPVGFMEVIPPPGVARSFFLGAMKAVFGNTKQKWIACTDIGKAAAKALLQPAESNGRDYIIVGQVATVDEVQVALAKGEGKSAVWSIWLPGWLVLWLSPYHYRQMFKWLAKGLQPGDVQTTKQLIPDVMDIETWAKRNLKRE